MQNSLLKKGLVYGIVGLLITITALPVARTMNDNKISRQVSSDYDNLVQQIIDADYITNGWSEEAKLLASDGATGDRFGISVSIDGDYAIVGAYYDDIGGHVYSGSAYIFKRSGTTWTQEAKLLPSDGATDDFFGVSVSINGDYAIVGAHWDDDSGSNSGSAYIFKRSGTTWTEEAKLLASDGATDDLFGISVSINGDYAIVGAWGDEAFTGAAYIFKRSGTTWTEEAKLLASDSATDDLFSVSVSINGDYVIVGAMWDDDSGSNSGSAYIFKRSGTTWTEEAKLLASDGATDDLFGVSVSIDGDYVIVGACCDDSGSDSGSAYIFKRSGTTWTEEAKLLASDGATDDLFGVSVSINGDYAIAGARGNEAFTGAAYIFKRSGTTWTEEAKLLASDGATEDEFGVSVSINGDYAIIGAFLDDDLGIYSGSVYVFKGPNQPPNAPDIVGETNGKKGTEYEYTFNAVDPDGDNVKYHIDWDDGDSDTTDFFSSGADVKVKHTWTNQDTYIIRVTAEDTNGLVGPEGTLSVTMPRNRATQRPFLQFLQNFLQQYPILYQLLQRFLQL